MHRESLRTAVVAAGLLATFAPACRSTVIDVPVGQPTIQLGIAAAGAGDTVLIAPGTYREPIDFLGKPIVVGSRYLTTGDPAYVDSTVLSGSEAMFGPLVTADTGEDSLSVLAGLTLTGGDALNGAGVYCRESSPRISGCVFRSNEAQNFGGGIYGWLASLIVEGCRFEENGAGFSGGGVCVYYGSPRISGNTFTGNAVGNTGGAILVEGGAPLICDNVIDGNTALATYAGGIMSRNNVAVIARNVVSNNLTYGYGGGLFY